MSPGPNASSNTVSAETLSGFVYFNWGGRTAQNSSRLITDTYNTVSGGGYTGSGLALFVYLYSPTNNAIYFYSYRSSYDLCWYFKSIHSMSGSLSRTVSSSNGDQLKQEVFTGLASPSDCAANARETPLYMFLDPN